MCPSRNNALGNFLDYFFFRKKVSNKNCLRIIQRNHDLISANSWLLQMSLVMLWAPQTPIAPPPHTHHSYWGWHLKSQRWQLSTLPHTTHMWETDMFKIWIKISFDIACKQELCVNSITHTKLSSWGFPGMQTQDKSQPQFGCSLRATTQTNQEVKVTGPTPWFEVPSPFLQWVTA